MWRFNKYYRSIPSSSDILGYMGLQRRDWTLALEAFGILAGGIAVGVAAGLLLAPKSGQEVRNDLYRRTDSLRQGVRQKLENARDNFAGSLEQPRNGRQL